MKYFIYIILLYCLLFTGYAIASQELPPAHPFTPFSSAETFANGKDYGLDENGILYRDYGARYNGLGKYHNPTFIASYANALYRDYVSGDASAKEKFLKQVDYLVDHASSNKTGAFWTYHFKNGHFLAPESWYSAMTSGRMLGVLIRAHALTNNTTYLDLAREVFRKLSRKRQLGGMTTYGKDQTAWLEEVAFPGSDSFKVLNGHIFSLAGVYDYAKYTRDPDARALFTAGVNAVAKWLDSFDSGFLSYYCEKMPSKSNRVFAGRGGYNIIHIHQMLWLYEVTGNSDFLKKAIAFQFYEDSYPEISVSHSTDEKAHGPEKMNLSFGQHYWASYQFPVQIRLKLKHASLLKGLVILAHTIKATPRDFLLETSMDGKNWIKMKRMIANKKLRKQILFNKSFTARYLRVTVEKDNGNGAVALDGFGLLHDIKETKIINFSNYSVGLKRIFDSDQKTGLKIKKTGWLLITNKPHTTQLIVYGDYRPPTFGQPDFYLEGSDDLDAWKVLGAEAEMTINQAVFNLPREKYRYYRLHFKIPGVKKINEVIMR